MSSDVRVHLDIKSNFDVFECEGGEVIIYLSQGWYSLSTGQYGESRKRKNPPSKVVKFLGNMKGVGEYMEGFLETVKEMRTAQDEVTLIKPANSISNMDLDEMLKVMDFLNTLAKPSKLVDK